MRHPRIVQRSLLSLLVLVSIVSLTMLPACSSLNLGAQSLVDPITPDDVHDLTMAATAVYLQQHPIPPATLKTINDTLAIARGQLTTDPPNLGAVKVLLVDQLPDDWKPLGAAGMSILSRRVHLEQLIEQGQTSVAAKYVMAAIDGAADALSLGAGAKPARYRVPDDELDFWHIPTPYKITVDGNT